MITKKLVIVESPAKAQTISKFIGKEYQVRASYGHIRDLPKTKMGIDIDDGFTPQYVVSRDKFTSKALKEIRSLYDSNSTDLYLATDEDREGEAIGWHLLQILKPRDDKKVKRIVFHEITKEAIQNAFNNPRTIDNNLVDAQQARRVLDRLVGYELSPILWKTIRTGLSAGRVQSVALRLVVEREKEIEAFLSDSQFRVTAHFLTEQDEVLPAELSKKFDSSDEAAAFLKDCIPASFIAGSITTRESKKSPPPPFTTSTMQQEASRKLGYSVKKTMLLAQRLYETGKITYMRTDSVQLSDFALNNAKNFIIDSFGKEYSRLRQYKTKSKSAQEAHEAIRPTDFSVMSTGNDSQEKKLYELIWRRAIASQMSDAVFDKTTVDIDISTRQEKFVARGEVLKFDGFLKVYKESSENGNGDGTENAHILKPVRKGEKLKADEIKAHERFSRPPPRYSEASLVRKLEELGIGRPSTYAPTISTIQARGYVVVESRPGISRMAQIIILKKGKIDSQQKEEITGAEKNKLFPTIMGTVVSDFLVSHFSDIVDYKFTAKIEKEFDDISLGKKVWNKMIADFYKKFHKRVEEKQKTVTRSEVLPERHLGEDPKSGKPISVRMGPYGLYVQLGSREDEEKPKFVSLHSDKTMESVTLEEALKLFELPRTIGKDEEGNEIQAQIGPYGPYIKVGKLFVSIAPISPFDITLEEALQKIRDKKEAQQKRIIKEFPGSAIKILNGRWGPYLNEGRTNARIPKKITEPEKLTLEECEKIMQENGSQGRGKKTVKSAQKKAKPVKKATSKAKKNATKKTLPKGKSSKSRNA